MLKSMLLSALLLAPTALIAESDQATSDLSLTEANNICYAIGRDPYKCRQAWRTCVWDYYQGCMPRFGGGGGGGGMYCGQITSPYQCNSQPNCFWDNVDGRCETTGADFCAQRYGVNQYACSRDPNCFWDSVDGRCESVR